MKKPTRTLCDQLVTKSTLEKFDGYIDAIRASRTAAAAFVEAMEKLQQATDDLEDQVMKLRDLAESGPHKDEYFKLDRQIEKTQRQRRAIEIGLIKFYTDGLMDKLWRTLP